MTAGRTGLRLFLCDEKTRSLVVGVREAVERALQGKFVNNTQGWDASTRLGRILHGLVTLLYNDKEG